MRAECARLAARAAQRRSAAARTLDAPAIAGDPTQFQIMYGLRGERRLTELTLDWLPGYGGSKPVRTGNGAYTQYQLDVLGEVAVGMYSTARFEGQGRPARWRAPSSS